MGPLMLAAGLVAPVLGALGAVLAAGPDGGRRARRAGCLVAAVAWAVLAIRGRVVVAAGFHATPLTAAVACGAALLVSSDRQAASRRSLVFGNLALTVVLVALTAGRRGEIAALLVAGLLFASACALLASKVRTVEARVAAASAGMGIVLTAIGFVVVHDATGEWALPRPGTGTISSGAALAFLIGAAALAVAGTIRPGRALGVLLAGGLGVGLLAAPLRGLTVPLGVTGGTESLVLGVVVLAAAGVAAAAVGRAGLAFACLALAVAAGPPGLTGASRLLAAAAVLAVAVDSRPAWVLGVPGGVALALGAARVADDAAIGLAVAAGLVAALLASRVGRPDEAGWQLDLAALPAALAGAWLFVAPGTWAWTGPSALGAYDRGAARAVAAGLVAVVLVGLRDELRRSGQGLRAHRAPTLADVLGRSDPLGAEGPGPSGPVRAGDAGPSGPVRAGDAGPSDEAPPAEKPRRSRRRPPAGGSDEPPEEAAERRADDDGTKVKGWSRRRQARRAAIREQRGLP